MIIHGRYGASKALESDIKSQKTVTWREALPQSVEDDLVCESDGVNADFYLRKSFESLSQTSKGTLII